MSKVPLEQYLDEGRGEPDLKGAAARLRDLLAQRPQRAWRLAVEEGLREPFRDDPQFREQDLREWQRLAMRASFESLHSKDHVRWGVSMLLTEAVLRPDRPKLRLGIGREQLLRWARGQAGTEAPVDAPLPKACGLVELAVVDARLAEPGSSQPERLQEALVVGLHSALGGLGFAQATRRTAVLRTLALVRCAVRFHDSDHEAEAKQLLLAAEMKFDVAEAFVNAVRDDRAIERFLGEWVDRPVRMESLVRSTLFMDACRWMGFDPDQAVEDVRYDGADPWIRRAVQDITGIQPSGQGLRDLWKRLPAANRTPLERQVCMELLARGRALTVEEATEIALQELGRAAIAAGHDDPEHDRKVRFARQMLARSVGSFLVAGAAETERELRALGGESLWSWFAAAWPRLKVSAAGALPPKLMETSVCIALLPEGFRADPRFADLGEDAAWAKQRATRKRNLDVLRQRGVAWLYEYVDWISHTADDHDEVWDATRGILQDSDRRRLAGWRRSVLERPSDLGWTSDRLSTSEELRMRESAARAFELAVAKGRNVTTHEDPEGLRSVAQAHMTDMLKRFVGQDQDHAFAAMNRCVEAVVLGDEAAERPNEGLLKAFRDGDVQEFRRRLLGASVDLPVAVAHPSRWNLEAAFVALLALVVIGSLAWQPLSVAMAKESAPPPQPSQGLPPGWMKADEGLFVFVFTDGHLQELFPGGSRLLVIEKPQHGRFVQTAFPMAEEVVRRFRAKCESDHPDGLPGIGAWTAVEPVSLPLPREDDAIQRACDVSGKGLVHTSDPVQWFDRSKWGVCVAVVRTKR